MARYDIGDIALVTATFTDETGTFQDPDTLKLRVLSPAGENLYAYPADPLIEKIDTGRYFASFALDEAGRWVWRWEATGDYASAQGGELDVQSDPFGDPFMDRLPTVDAVAALLRARTKDDLGNEGEFTGRTRPTYEEVQTLIGMARDDVVVEVGVEADVPERWRSSVRTLITLRAAMLVELTYFPEQIENNKSAYTAYERMYLRRIEKMANDTGGEPNERKSWGSVAVTSLSADVLPLVPGAVNGGCW